MEFTLTSMFLQFLIASFCLQSFFQVLQLTHHLIRRTQLKMFFFLFFFFVSFFVLCSDFKWVFNFDNLVNVSSQIWHINIVCAFPCFPHCTLLLCLCNLALDINVLSHFLHWNCCGFICTNVTWFSNAFCLK